ncbi:ATP-binding protein [Streptacidiphilus pinicola]|uniref:histidine kinase n=1 Tax=Streptacidiphilus pinicola TaxID=2219663 RepID=A0A2X0IHK4_9ACTN|nr:ATP-binding protein [Streptacidiphilus pinicola]RAG82881.1 ATP-binding protein [Streptacidiphilus pinicola]
MSSLDTLADRLGRRLARLPFRRKLNALIVIPLVVVALLVAVAMNGQVNQAESAAAEAELLGNSATVARLVDDIQQEQAQAILYYESYWNTPVGSKRNLADRTPYLTAQHATDLQLSAVRRVFGGAMPPELDTALQKLDPDGLGLAREAIATGLLPAENIDAAYGDVSEGLIDGLGLTAQQRNQTTARLADQLDVLLRADSSHAQFETSVVSALTRDSDATVQFGVAESSYQLYRAQETRFAVIAPLERSSALYQLDFGPDETQLEATLGDLAQKISAVADPTSADLAAGSRAAQALEPTVVRESQRRATVIDQLIPQLATEAQQDSTRAWWRASILLALAVVLLLGWVLLLTLIRRSILGPLQRVTDAARRVSELSAQELARVADEDTPAADGLPQLEDLPITAADEIGELARAFNQVQATAGGLLERQAQSRRNTAEMFGNIGRRVANLTGRQLALIDAVERDETDPALLDRLYRIDHIAVRLQRNADSLMLLAGLSDTELDGRPAELSHVVRAALGQIEGFERVRLIAEADATVTPDLVNDLVLVLAELLENAVTFSPAHTEVAVTLRERAGQAVLEIVDHGLGMSAERLAEENGRLVRRARLDLAPTQVLGLFVVGVLARRWDLQVVLSRTPGGGLTCDLTLPTDLVTPGAPRAGRTWSPTATPERSAAAPLPAAAPERSTVGSALGGEARPAPQTNLAHVVLPPPSLPRDRPDGPPGGGLKRRVRGATLREGRRPAEPFAARPADPDEVRSSLEEFEAAVSRAERDSTINTPERTEGVGQ